MADITVTCQSCGKGFTISEFADLAQVACPACGKPVKAPQQEDSGKPRLSLRKDSPAGASPERVAADRPAVPADVVPAGTRLQLPTGRRGLSHVAVGWIVFLALGAVMGAVRYGGFVSADTLALIRDYGWCLALAVHVFIVWKAFEDAVFYGLLCLLVPFFSLYYLFLISDRFLLRAVVAGMLVGIGQDTANVVQKTATETINAVSGWIERGAE